MLRKKDVTLTVKSNKASAAEKKELQDEVDSVAGQIADKDNYTAESYQKTERCGRCSKQTAQERNCFPKADRRCKSCDRRGKRQAGIKIRC